MNRTNIILIGFMGTGKSAISRRLNKLTGMKEVDTDAMIVEREGMSIPEIFDKKGEDAFRNMETELLRELKNKKNLIISCGGGMALRDENSAIMKEVGTVVWLKATPQTILKRVEHDDNRPLLRGNKNVEFIGNLLDQRSPKYEAASHFSVTTDNRTIQAISEEIIRRI